MNRIKNKILLVGILCCFMFFSVLSVQAVEPIKITVDDNPLVFTDQVALYDNEKELVLIPLRDVCEAVGAEVKWDSSEQKAVVKLMNKSVDVPIGTSQVTVNNKPV
ncbi:MAG TPA: hypothetical protein DD791_03845, partial [Syntrophomonas sp.]|nr:hypothetical protein [Syntrophomonas sp.]